MIQQPNYFFDIKEQHLIGYIYTFDGTHRQTYNKVIEIFENLPKFDHYKDDKYYYTKYWNFKKIDVKCENIFCFSGVNSYKKAFLLCFKNFSLFRKELK